MAKFGGSKMYPRGPMIAHSASNCVADLPIGIDKDFFRSLLRMAVLWLENSVGNRSLRSRLGRRDCTFFGSVLRMADPCYGFTRTAMRKRTGPGTPSTERHMTKCSHREVKRSRAS